MEKKNASSALPPPKVEGRGREAGKNRAATRVREVSLGDHGGRLDALTERMAGPRAKSGVRGRRAPGRRWSRF